LVPVASEAINVDSTASYRPKAPTTAVVTQVTGMVHTAGENALARAFDQAFAVGWSEPIGGPAHEGFNTANFRAAERIEFRQLNDPDTLGLQHRILGAQVR
jgi:hypothetical protein